MRYREGRSRTSPEGIIPIGCKWIFKKNIGGDGQMDIGTNGDEQIELSCLLYTF